MTNLLVWIVLGGVIGLIANMVTRGDTPRRVLWDVLVGMIGALLAGWFLSPLFGVLSTSQNELSMTAMLLALAGAVILLGVFNLLRRSTVP